VDDAREYAAQGTEDSINVARLNHEMKRAERQEKRELEKREKEIKALQFEKELSVRQMKKQRTKLIALVIGVPLAVILLAVFFVVRRSRRREAEYAQNDHSQSSGPPPPLTSSQWHDASHSLRK
jgi:hypothetical protein